MIAAGTYRETVLVPQTKTGLTFLGATRDARDVVIVFDNAAGTAKPDGGTYGTGGSATTTIQADGFTATHVTFANDWLRADHPEITATQAVAVKVMGDRSAFEACRFLGHQDTLYADTRGLATFARQYYRRCHVFRLRARAVPRSSTPKPGFTMNHDTEPTGPCGGYPLAARPPSPSSRPDTHEQLFRRVRASTRVFSRTGLRDPGQGRRLRPGFRRCSLGGQARA